MIDFTKYEIVKASRMKFRNLYFGNGSHQDYRNAFNELWGHMDALLCQFEDDLAQLDEYCNKEQEEAMRQDVLDRSDDLYNAQCEYEIAERCENQG